MYWLQERPKMKPLSLCTMCLQEPNLKDQFVMVDPVVVLVKANQFVLELESRVVKINQQRSNILQQKMELGICLKIYQNC